MDTLDFAVWKEPLHATSNENLFQYIYISIIYVHTTFQKFGVCKSFLNNTFIQQRCIRLI